MLLAGACTPSTFVWDDTVPASLQEYRTAFAEAVGTKLGDSLTRDELLQNIGEGRVLWLGDHHSNSSCSTRCTAAENAWCWRSKRSGCRTSRT